MANNNNVVGQLESFVDTWGKTRLLKHRFHRESRLRYRINNVDELLANDCELLLKFIRHHKQRQRPRLIELMDYANGMNHDVSENEFRRSEADMTDVRAIHDFGGMVSVFKEGYLTGVPLIVNYESDDKEDIQAIIDESAKINGFNKLNRGLVLDMSRVGRAYELVYRREDDKTIVRKLDPFQTFVIYDTSISNHSVAAIRYYQNGTFDDSNETVELYTDNLIYHFTLQQGKLTLVDEPELHSFGQVPITEFLNDEQGFGDYERVLNLIDLYDSAQSDTANFMADMSDSILAIFGNIDFGENISRESQLELQKAMRRARLMMFKPATDVEGKDSGSIDAKYLTKAYDVNGTEAYKTRIEEDIHKFTNMPNLSDSNFSGTQSGEAMKYKLFGLDQKRIDTQDLLIESLKRRYELIMTIESILGRAKDFDITKLSITVTPNLPQAFSEIITNFKNLGGMVSNETAMRVTGIVENPQNELEKLKEEQSSDDLGGYDYEDN